MVKKLFAWIQEEVAFLFTRMSMENYKGLVWNVIFESDTHTMIHNTYNEG
jgi:hypothetical protein